MNSVPNAGIGFSTAACAGSRNVNGRLRFATRHEELSRYSSGIPRPPAPEPAMSRPSLALIASLAASAAFAQVPPGQAEATFRVNDRDLEFKLWASEELG